MARRTVRSEHFIRVAAKRMNRRPPKFTPAAARQLSARDWPGNVRELQNAVERAVILSQGSPLLFDEPAVPAMAQDRSVQVVNNSGFTIVEFYASTQGAVDWQENMLAGQAVGSGANLTVNFDDGSGECAYAFRAVFDDGDEAVGDIDICSGSSITIN